jgi:hypothetical protein
MQLRIMRRRGTYRRLILLSWNRISTRCRTFLCVKFLSIHALKNPAVSIEYPLPHKTFIARNVYNPWKFTCCCGPGVGINNHGSIFLFSTGHRTKIDEFRCRLPYCISSESITNLPSSLLALYLGLYVLLYRDKICSILLFDSLYLPSLVWHLQKQIPY